MKINLLPHKSLFGLIATFHNTAVNNRFDWFISMTLLRERQSGEETMSSK